MTAQWSGLHSLTSKQKRLRVVIVSPVEEPDARYLDIRRTFTKNGQLRYSQTGNRTLVDSLDLKEMESAILSIARVQRTEAEVAKFHFQRRAGLLQIHRVKEEEEGEDEESNSKRPRVRLALIIPEVKFLYESLQFLREKLEGQSGEEEEEEEDDDDP